MPANVILHIIPFAYLGGTEKDCLYFIEADKEHQHLVYVLNKDDAMVQQWTDAGAKVQILDILDLSDKDFHSALFKSVNELDVKAILYWSTIKLPLVRYALRDMKCRLAVHVGNPSQLGVFSSLKQIAYHVYYYSDIETCLFPCSEYVRKSLSVNPFYNKFQMRVSINPVRLLVDNPYKPRILKTDSEVIIGMTARLDTIKDHITLIRGFSEVIKTYKNAKLWLLGDGLLRNDLEQLVTKLKVKDNVVFWGRVENVYEMLQKIDIFVYSTTFKEGLGNAVSEAMANGLPCILSDLPMMHEIAGDIENVIFFTSKDYIQLANEIIILINDNELRAQLSLRAFKRANSTFSAKRYVDYRLQFLI
jgi:glycosyltransferase involved in cell wall biosynthesis